MLTEILPDIYMLQMPIPESRVRSIDHIRLFIIRGPERNLLFDTGINQPSSLEPVLAAFDELGISMENTDIFVSHLHPDHCGLAYKLQTGKRFTAAKELQTAAAFNSTSVSSEDTESITASELQSAAAFNSASVSPEVAESNSADELQTVEEFDSAGDLQKTAKEMNFANKSQENPESNSAGDTCHAARRRPRVYAHEKEAELIRIVSSEEYWRGRYNEYLTEGLPMNFEEFYNSHPAAEHFTESDIDFTILQDGDVIDLGVPIDATAKVSDCSRESGGTTTEAVGYCEVPGDAAAEVSDYSKESGDMAAEAVGCCKGPGGAAAEVSDCSRESDDMAAEAVGCCEVPGDAAAEVSDYSKESGDMAAEAVGCCEDSDSVPAETADFSRDLGDTTPEHSAGNGAAAQPDRLQNAKWRCIVTSGHSPAHTCLYNEEQQILLGGDVILDNVVPILFPEPDFPNPLGAYLAGLDHLASLPISHFLSCHETVEFDFRERIQQLKNHYMKKCDRILELIQIKSAHCDDWPGITAWDMARLTVRDEIPRDLEQLSPVTRWFFYLPILACLRYLECNKKVTVHIDAENVHRYTLA